MTVETDPHSPVEATNLTTLLHGAPSDAKAAVRMAAELEDLQSYLRTIRRRDDAFAGYSIAEALQERINEIGKPGSAEYNGVSVDADLSPGNTHGGRLTLLAKLAYLEEKLLGRDGSPGLIETAKGMSPPENLAGVQTEASDGGA